MMKVLNYYQAINSLSKQALIKHKIVELQIIAKYLSDYTESNLGFSNTRNVMSSNNGQIVRFQQSEFEIIENLVNQQSSNEVINIGISNSGKIIIK